MKILYFTGTGNSYDVATRLGGDLLDMATCVADKIEDSVVGIVCPVYCNDVPAVVADFLRRTPVCAEYIFAVVTAGAACGNALSAIAMYLAGQGAHLNFGATLVMPDSCIVFHTPLKTQQLQMAELPAKIAELQTAIAARAQTNIAKKTCPTLGTKAMWFFMNRILGIKNKSSDTQKCIQCKKCESCPVGNIVVDKAGVHFGTKCVNCFRCIQICPKGAIKFGRLVRVDEGRYLNQNWYKSLERGEK